MAGQPCFVGIQAEGREWPTLVSKETIAKFDYIFTDAMTIVDHRGRRARLWIKEEVDIPDAQEFMELLVRTIEDILADEPVDIYANPTYLPAVLAKDYDRLWTPERKQRVIRRRGGQRRGHRDQQPPAAAQAGFHSGGQGGRHPLHAGHEQRQPRAGPRGVRPGDDPPVPPHLAGHVDAQARRTKADPGEETVAACRSGRRPYFRAGWR